MDQHANFAEAVIVTAPSPSTSGTTATVQAGQGALLPTPPFNATVYPTNVRPLYSNAEIVRVQTVIGDILTFDRQQEGTLAQPIQVGYTLSATLTVKTITDIETAAGQPGPAIGVSGRHYSKLTVVNSGYTTPANAIFDLTTRLRTRYLILADNLATGVSQDIYCKWNESGNHRCWKTGIDANGFLRAAFATDGTNTTNRTLTSSVSIPSLNLKEKQAIWIDILLLSNVAGQSEASFAYSFDYVNWIPLGVNPVLNVHPGPFLVDSAAQVQLGQTQTALNFFAGRLYVAELYDASDTLISRFDARGLVNNTDNYADVIGAGRTWTHQASTLVKQDEINDQDFLRSTLEPTALVSGNANDILTIDATSGKAAWKSQGVSKEFDLYKNGAALDGTTNDTAVILAAIASGKTIIHPGGICLLSPDNFIIPHGIKLRGVGFEYNEGAGTNQRYGSVFKAAGAGTLLAQINGSDVGIEGVGFDGNQLCTGPIFEVNGPDSHIDEVCITNPSATGSCFHTTLGSSLGARVVVGRLWFAGNMVAGSKGLFLEGNDGEFGEIHCAQCDYNVLVYAGGNQIGIIHSAQNTSAGVGQHHFVICATKFYVNNAQLDNGLDSMIYFDPAAKGGAQAFGDISFDTLHCNIGGSTPTPPNSISAVKFNTAPAATMFGIRLVGSVSNGGSTQQFLYAVDYGVNPANVIGDTIDLRFKNPGSTDATGNPLITPATKRPDILAATVCVDSGAATWKPSKKTVVSTQTPGAVTTVTIPHGLYGTPISFALTPQEAHAAAAPAYYLTADATNVTVHFVSALTAATAYTWQLRSEM